MRFLEILSVDLEVRICVGQMGDRSDIIRVQPHFRIQYTITN